MDYLIALAVCLPIAIAISIPWVNAIDKRKNDPEWQGFKSCPRVGGIPERGRRLRGI